ncbi:MAG TPA: hypothetical protein VGO08_00180 [Burkholderiales bacterium]|jgi:hypothetical protein|nr:hypothetical protein [Burkholderiales bacterium]
MVEEARVAEQQAQMNEMAARAAAAAAADATAHAGDIYFGNLTFRNQAEVLA